MTGAKLQKLLFRIYINWAITLLILFLPKLMRHSREHIAQASELGELAEQKSEFAAGLAEDAENYSNREWRETKARELEQETGAAARKSELCGETPANFRDTRWCEERAAKFKQLSGNVEAEAAAHERRAARHVRWANALALLDILPYWSIGAILPWILHFAVAGLLRRQAGAPPHPKHPAPPAGGDGA